MQTVDFTHNPWLVAASFCVALMAGFTGLSLTRGVSALPDWRRKVAISASAVALGGGIWSMHFVAMLGLQMPILFYYDAAVTLSSALVAVLVTGLSLLILHYGPRRRARLMLAGAILGLGIIAMHYIGMAAIEMCRALYTLPGVAAAVVASCGLSMAAIAIAYGRRTRQSILLGTVVFGVAVFAVHFIAIAGTRFVVTGDAPLGGPLMSNEVLAIGVVLSAFALCGAFLLTGVTFLPEAAPVSPVVPSSEPAPVVPEPEPEVAPHRAQPVPFEREGRTQFVDPARVAAIRAEGHYTYIYTPEGQFFCAWSITEAGKRLRDARFVKAHRSYLINPALVSGFERTKDTGVCYFEVPGLEKVPVSRTQLRAVREVLGV